jgi:hypothetical protein
MAQLRDLGGLGLNAKLGEQSLIIEIIGSGCLACDRSTKQTSVIHGRNEGSALLQIAYPVQAHGIEPFEDIAVLAMLRGAAMLIDETLDFFEACYDAFFPRCPAGRFLLFDFDPKLGQKGIIVIGEVLSHWQPPPSCAS